MSLAAATGDHHQQRQYHLQLHRQQPQQQQQTGGINMDGGDSASRQMTMFSDGHVPTATSTPQQKTKDDTCTQTRVRHPTDRGYDPSTAPLSPFGTSASGGQNAFFDQCESRSRAYTMGARPPNYHGARTNVYKRAEGAPSISSPATTVSVGCVIAPFVAAKNNQSTPTPIAMANKDSGSNGSHHHHSNSAGDDSEDAKPSKQLRGESWLHKSWRAAQSHVHPHSNGSYSLNKDKSPPPLVFEVSPTAQPSPDFQHHYPQQHRKSAVVVSGGGGTGGRPPVTGFLDRLRPRSNSDATGAASAAQQVLINRRKKAAAEAAINKSTRVDSPSVNQSSRRSSGIYCEDDGDASFGGFGQYSPVGGLPQVRESAIGADGSGADDAADMEVDSLVELEDADIFDGLSPMPMRKRSNSEASNYLIMRKTSRPNTTEVVGALGRNDDAYKQLLSKFTCYDLMPYQGAVINIDCQLPTRQALAALSENGVRAALLWDPRQRAPIAFLTVTDLLRILCAFLSGAIGGGSSPPPSAPPSQSQQKTPLSPKNSKPNEGQQQQRRGSIPRARNHDSSSSSPSHSHESSDINQQPILSNLIKAGSTKFGKQTMKFWALTTVGIEETLHSAASTLRSNRIHRVAIVDHDTGNPLYLLSSKRLLQFLYNHMTNLPLPQAVYKSLDELRLGVWRDSTLNSQLNTIISVTLTDSVLDASQKLLEHNLSSLPVLETCVKNNSSGSNSASNGSSSKTRTPSVNISSNNMEDDQQVMEMDPPDYCSCDPNRLLDALTKVDLLHFILVNGWSDLGEKTVQDVLKARTPTMEKLITCHRKTPLSLAIDRMIQTNAHRIYIVDSSGVLEGLFSVGDLLSYLLD